MALSIMIQGTASGVGKSLIALALCRIFSQDGYKVAPFKAQNMTRNTALTKSGHEIAVSQLLQALASNAQPLASMNPLILKPSASATDIILSGKPFKSVPPNSFESYKSSLIPHIADAFRSLNDAFDIIVIEGAGSPVELNLNNNDIVNMGMAKLANAPVILVSNIDKGGIFASLFGTIALLNQDKSFVKATIINRFIGDIFNFHPGADILQNITAVPVAGIVPFFPLSLPEEDLPYNPNAPSFSHNSDFSDQFDSIADHVRPTLNLKLIYNILKDGI